MVNGHVHAYERSQPLFNNAVVQQVATGGSYTNFYTEQGALTPPWGAISGTTYICAGGGGQSLYTTWYGYSSGDDSTSGDGKVTGDSNTNTFTTVVCNSVQPPAATPEVSANAVLDLDPGKLLVVLVVAVIVLGPERLPKLAPAGRQVRCGPTSDAGARASRTKCDGDSLNFLRPTRWCEQCGRRSRF